MSIPVNSFGSRSGLAYANVAKKEAGSGASSVQLPVNGPAAAGASGANAVAVGADAVASNASDIAIGHDASASGGHGIVLGDAAVTAIGNGIAIGNGATAASWVLNTSAPIALTANASALAGGDVTGGGGAATNGLRVRINGTNYTIGLYADA